MNHDEARGALPLSPAAEITLNEAMQEMRREVVWKASKYASRGGTGEAIGVLDIAKALQESGGPTRRIRRSITLLTWVSLAYFLAAVILIIGTRILNTRLSEEMRTATLLMLGCGVPMLAYWVTEFTSRGLNRIWHKGRAADVEILQLLRLWISIENALKVRFSREFGESRATAPIREILRKLEAGGSISPENAKNIQRLQHARNQLAHGQNFDKSRENIKELLFLAHKVLRELDERA